MSKRTLDEIAPCGVLCFTCPSLVKGTCKGCRSEEKQKRTSKLACKIRRCCIGEKNLELCIDCEEFPCKKFHEKLLKTHAEELKYQYRRDTLEHAELIRKEGLKKALEILDKRWTCSDCGGRIIMYEYKCFDCGRDYINEMQNFKPKKIKYIPNSKPKKRLKIKKEAKAGKSEKKIDKKKVEDPLAAPCGLYCGVCRHYLMKKKNILEERGYKQGCDGCKIRNKNCTHIKRDCPHYKANKVQYCFECSDFPCFNLHRMDDIYQVKYNINMIGNLERIKEVGVKKWLQEQQELYKCPKCGGEISMHDFECFDCGLKLNPNKN